MPILVNAAIVMALTGVDVVLVTLSVLGVAATIFLVNHGSGSR